MIKNFKYYWKFYETATPHYTIALQNYRRSTILMLILIITSVVLNQPALYLVFMFFALKSIFWCTIYYNHNKISEERMNNS